MKLYNKIDVRDDLYIAEIGRPELTPNEEDKLRQFGEPFVQIGGTFANTVTRPGYINTTLAFIGGGGTSAAAVPILNASGGIEAVAISDPGSGYTSAPTITITGVGTGASLTATVTSNAVSSVTVVAQGYGYQMTPANVNFTLPSCMRRLLTDFPVTKIFSLNDTYDADAQAQVWVQAVQANMVQARNILLLQAAPLEGETLQTV